MIYRLLAINLDGALLSSKGRVHRLTKLALEEVKDKEVEIALYTKFSYQHALKMAKMLPFKTHIIANQGGYITNNSNEPILNKRISESTALDIVRLLESMDCYIRVIHENFTLANTLQFPSEIASKIKWTTGDYTFYTQQYVESLTEHMLLDAIAPLQIDVYFEQDSDHIEVIDAIHSLFSNISIHCEKDGKMTILPEQVSLQNGLLALLEQLNIELAKTVVIGCHEADNEMVESAGLGIALANAEMTTKNVADWITRSNDGLGVAYAAREVFRKQQQLSFLKRIKNENY